jgi:hypothetical protein
MGNLGDLFYKEKYKRKLPADVTHLSGLNILKREGEERIHYCTFNYWSKKLLRSL